MRKRITTGLLAGGLAAVTAAGAGAAEGGRTERVSLGRGGTQGNGGSSVPSISADGRFVAFTSVATNLVPGDTNRRADVLVRDRQSDRTERVSVATGGAQAGSGGTDGSAFPSISGDGRFVAFQSDQPDLVPGDTNSRNDVFVHDRRNDRTERVSVTTGGAEGNEASTLPSISADGRYVAYQSSASNLVPGDTNAAFDVFLHDRKTGRTELVSVGPDDGPANDSSFRPSISADGRFVAFVSAATDLAAGDANGRIDVFVRDRQTGLTERVSVGRDGGDTDGFAEGSSISADGRYVAFASDATNLVPSDTNGTDDVFVRDRQANRTELVSVGSGGTKANRGSGIPSISADGRRVAFASGATNLVPGDTNGVFDVFVRDRARKTTERVSVATNGAQAGRRSSGSGENSISADGSVVAFNSNAANLVPGDTNKRFDVFVRSR